MGVGVSLVFGVGVRVVFTVSVLVLVAEGARVDVGRVAVGGLVGTPANFVGGTAVGSFAGTWVSTQAGTRNKGKNSNRIDLYAFTYLQTVRIVPELVVLSPFKQAPASDASASNYTSKPCEKQKGQTCPLHASALSFAPVCINAQRH